MLARVPKFQVLLVDSEIRHPSIHRYFGCFPEYGIVEHLVAVKLGAAKRRGIQGTLEAGQTELLGAVFNMSGEPIRPYY